MFVSGRFFGENRKLSRALLFILKPIGTNFQADGFFPTPDCEGTSWLGAPVGRAEWWRWWKTQNNSDFLASFGPTRMAIHVYPIVRTKLRAESSKLVRSKGSTLRWVFLNFLVSGVARNTLWIAHSRGELVGNFGSFRVYQWWILVKKTCTYQPPWLPNKD